MNNKLMIFVPGNTYINCLNQDSKDFRINRIKNKNRFKVNDILIISTLK